MSSTVRIAEPSGNNGYGEETYGTDVAYKAHLARQRKIVRNILGQEVVSNQALYLMAAPNVSLSARVTLSTADVGSTQNEAIYPRIMSVERRFDQTGPHHTVVYLG